MLTALGTYWKFVSNALNDMLTLHLHENIDSSEQHPLKKEGRRICEQAAPDEHTQEWDTSSSATGAPSPNTCYCTSVTHTKPFNVYVHTLNNPGLMDPYIVCVHVRTYVRTVIAPCHVLVSILKYCYAHQYLVPKLLCTYIVNLMYAVNWKTSPLWRNVNPGMVTSH